MRDLSPIFEPKSIAVIGATSDPQSVTNMTFLRQLLDFGYPGRIYPVNPRAEQILGLRAYPSLEAIPEPVDYVICALAASAAPAAVQQCVKAKVKAVSLFTAGFSENSEQGAAIEREVARIAREGGVLLLGPNCMGVHCPRAGIALEGSIDRKSGHVGFISQSGGIATEVIPALAEREIFVSKLVSMGNAADLNESDYLEYFGQDDDTHVVGAYLEGLKQPHRFLDIARRVAGNKPVIVVKGGSTAAGAGAVRLHTGALAGSRTIWRAMCAQAGIIMADDLRDVVDTIQAFTYIRPCGRRVGIIGVGGGFGVLGADQCTDAGLVVPELSSEIKAELAKYTPSAGTGLRNPVDTTINAYTSPETLGATVRALASWNGVDVIFVAFRTHLGIRIGFHYLTAGFDAVIRAARESGKPVVIILATSNFAESEIKSWELQKHCFAQGIPVYFTFTQAAKALNQLVGYYERATTRASICSGADG